jgi:hypothetical protein
LSPLFSSDSPGKKLSRVDLWSSVEGILGKDFRLRTHVVLAGTRGSDISTLLGKGVDRKNIVAVDSNRHAVHSTRFRYPGVEVLYSDIEEAIGKLSPQRPIGSVYMDLCCNLNEISVPMIQRCSASVTNSVFGVTMFAGREKGRIGKCFGSEDPVQARLKFIRSALNRRVQFCASYINSKNHLMVTVADSGDRNGIIPSLKKYSGGEAENLLRKQILESDLRGERTDLLYGISRQTIAAIKAHDTRGTYGNSRA